MRIGRRRAGALLRRHRRRAARRSIDAAPTGSSRRGGRHGREQNPLKLPTPMQVHRNPCTCIRPFHHRALPLVIPAPWNERHGRARGHQFARSMAQLQIGGVELPTAAYPRECHAGALEKRWESSASVKEKIAGFADQTGVVGTLPSASSGRIDRMMVRSGWSGLRWNVMYGVCRNQSTGCEPWSFDRATDLPHSVNVGL